MAKPRASASPPPPNPAGDAGNNLGAQAVTGPGGTLVDSNPNPDRGGTQLPQGQAAATNPPRPASS
jgi:hypothetical protein